MRYIWWFFHPQKHDAIDCNIINTILNAKEENSETLNESEYEALPYTWESPDVKKIISIDGQTCTIRENLWLALYHLRLKDISRILWIDALYIDQNNIKKRNHQVAQKGKKELV
jgi:Heterokaryon incompatibility protein (HET)